MSIDQGKDAARLCFINVLVHLKAACGGDLDRVRRVVRLGGFIASPSEFTQQALVMNGASDLIIVSSRCEMASSTPAKVSNPPYRAGIPRVPKIAMRGT